jgi:hypothetical protein
MAGPRTPFFARWSGRGRRILRVLAAGPFRRGNRVAWAALLAGMTLLAGCGGGSAGGGAGADDTVARVVISPGAILLTGAGESRTLVAQAYNKAGDPLPDASFTWSTNHPATVEVDGHGVITAQVGVGSAQITAAADGVESAPLLALVATTVPSAVLVPDDQVAEAPVPVDPAADLDIGYRMAVTLFDAPGIPAVGSTIVGTGVHPIGGVVVATDPQGNGTTQVTYEMVALSELFTELAIDESFDLAKLPLGEEDPDSLYDVEVLPNGDLKFTLKPGAPAPAQPKPNAPAPGARLAMQKSWKGKLGPFDCKADVTPPVKIDANPKSFTISRQMALGVKYRIPASSVQDLQFVKLSGTIAAEFKANLKVTNNLTAKVVCTYQPKRARIPAPIPAGPLSGLLTAEVQLGAEVDLGGEIDAPDVAFEAKATASANGSVSLDCPPPGNGDCEPHASFSAPNPTSEYKIDVPDPALLPTALIFKPELAAFGTASLSGGLNSAIPGSGLLRGELAKGKAGLKQAGEFSFVNNQVYDDNLAANYALTFEWEAGVGSTIQKILKFFGISASAATFSGTPIQVAESPKATEAKSDVSTFTMGDTVKFSVELDPQTVDYTPLIGYNVDTVKIYRRAAGSASELVAFAFPATGQTSLEIPWVADGSGSIDGDGYYAFVETRLVPIDDVGELELRRVISGQQCTQDPFPRDFMFYAGPISGQLDPSDPTTTITDYVLEVGFLLTGNTLSGYLDQPGDLTNNHGAHISLRNITGSLVDTGGATQIEFEGTLDDNAGMTTDDGPIQAWPPLMGTNVIHFSGTLTGVPNPGDTEAPCLPVFHGTDSLGGPWAMWFLGYDLPSGVSF